jgi:DNA-directed RNA polymerase subunit omega
MTRASVDDCLLVVPNRFELCSIATKRARQLARGAPSQIPAGDHKSTVQSLLEIARGQVSYEVLLEADLPVIERPRPNLDGLDPFGDL